MWVELFFDAQAIVLCRETTRTDPFSAVANFAVVTALLEPLFPKFPSPLAGHHVQRGSQPVPSISTAIQGFHGIGLKMFQCDVSVSTIMKTVASDDLVLSSASLKTKVKRV